VFGLTGIGRAGAGDWFDLVAPEELQRFYDSARAQVRTSGVPGAAELAALPDRVGDWVSVLYMAVFAGAGAMIGQTWAQAHLPATRAAIIMSMEPVFAALFAVLFGGESATVRMIVGGLLVLAAMLLAELAPRRKVEAEVTHLTV